MEATAVETVKYNLNKLQNKNVCLPKSLTSVRFDFDMSNKISIQAAGTHTHTRFLNHMNA